MCAFGVHPSTLALESMGFGFSARLSRSDYVFEELEILVGYLHLENRAGDGARTRGLCRGGEPVRSTFNRRKEYGRRGKSLYL